MTNSLNSHLIHKRGALNRTVCAAPDVSMVNIGCKMRAAQNTAPVP